MQEDFQQALELVLSYEGGKINDPHDAGGKTNQGVTQRTYDFYRKSKKLPKRDVYSMENNERDEIYREQYWDAVKGNMLPPGISFVVFDGAVNSGPLRSVSWLQEALGDAYTGKIDGIVSTLTINALKETFDHDAVIEKICSIRLAYMKNLKTWDRYKKGWQKRVRNVLLNGQALARGRVGPKVIWNYEVDDSMRKKALVSDAKAKVPVGVADGLSGGGIGIAAVSQTITEAKTSLIPYAGQNDYVDRLLMFLTVAGVFFIFAGLAWRIVAKVKNDRRNKLTKALT